MNRDKTARLKERARHLFVEESNSLPLIAKKIGVPEGTLSRWRSNNKWAEAKRLKDPSAVNGYKETPMRVPDTVNEALGIELTGNAAALIAKWDTLLKEHEEVFARGRGFASEIIGVLEDKLEGLQDNGDIEEIGKVAKIMLDWMKVADLAIKGERTAISADYYDINRAILLVKAYGYNLISHSASEQLQSESDSSGGVSDEFADHIEREDLGIEGDFSSVSEEMESGQFSSEGVFEV